MKIDWNNKMEWEKIKEGNKLIAEFMGYIYTYEAHEDFSDIGGLYSDVIYYSKEPLEFEFIHDDGRGEGVKNIYEAGKFKDMITTVVGGYGMMDYDNSLKYHESWDWLMPVVHKCCDNLRLLGFDKRGTWDPKLGYVSEIYVMRLDNPIDKVWLEVVKHIKRYSKKNDI